MKFQAKYANGEEFTLTATDIDQAIKKASEWQETIGASLNELQPLSLSPVRPLSLLTEKELNVLYEGLVELKLSDDHHLNTKTVAEDLQKKIREELETRDAKKYKV